MSLRPIPFIGGARYRVDQRGRVFEIRAASRRGHAPRPMPAKPIDRSTAEDVLRHFIGGRNRPGEHMALVAPPGWPPAGDRAMVWCFIRKPSAQAPTIRTRAKLAAPPPPPKRGELPHDIIESGCDGWSGAFIEAHGDTHAGWYRLHLEPGDALVHGASVAALAFPGGPVDG
jgi:hypothetical protein